MGCKFVKKTNIINIQIIVGYGSDNPTWTIPNGLKSQSHIPSWKCSFGAKISATMVNRDPILLDYLQSQVHLGLIGVFGPSYLNVFCWPSPVRLALLDQSQLGHPNAPMLSGTVTIDQPPHSGESKSDQSVDMEGVAPADGGTKHTREGHGDHGGQLIREGRYQRDGKGDQRMVKIKEGSGKDGK